MKEDIDISVRKGAVLIRSSRAPRAGWAEAARRLRERSGDRLLDEPAATRFDAKEWRWR